MSGLDASSRAVVEGCRTATLATTAPDGRARLVPICFTLDDSGTRLYMPLDEKPKRATDARDLARVRDIRARSEVALLFHRWSEDWSMLAWVRVHGRAGLLEPGHDPGLRESVISSLRQKYAQYRGHDLERATLIVIEIVEATRWSAADAASDPAGRDAGQVTTETGDVGGGHR
jgi:PPOX class probable F420-dependent enzyme